MKLQTLSLRKLRALGPCYDPIKYYDSKWRGTLVDVLQDKRISYNDKRWLIRQKEIAPIKVLVLWSCWCARQACRTTEHKDERSLKAIKLAEQYTKGKPIAKEELAAAYAYAAYAYAAAAYDDATAAYAAAAYAAAAYAYADAATAAYAAAYDADAKEAAQKKQIKRLVLLLKRYEASK